MQKIIFLDTNIYLHYQDIEQINWLEIAQADAVTIVVPPITIRELNKLKDSHQRKRIRKRAGIILKRLLKLVNSNSTLQAPLSKYITIQLEGREPQVDFGDYQLSREIQDDNLIASIIMCQNENPDSEISLVTSDFGLTLIVKALQHEIKTIRLPDSFMLPEEPDQEQERIKQLEQELQLMKQKLPLLSLTFADGSKHGAFVLSNPLELTQKKIADKINELKRIHPKMSEQPRQIDNSQLATLKLNKIIAENALINKNISEEDIAEYNTKLDNFYKAYEEYMQHEINFKNMMRRTIRLKIHLSNDGTAPTEDIDIFMHFPDGLTVMSKDASKNPPTPPSPPSKPKTALEEAFEKLRQPFQDIINIPHLGRVTPDSIQPPPNVSSPSIRRTSSYSVGVHVQRLKHKLHESLDTLFVTFNSFDSIRSFHIDYKILAADLPSETSGQLHIKLQME